MRFQSKGGSKYRALVVDDDRTTLELSCAMLVDNGFMADKAYSGDEAITLCSRHVYDLVFMDIEMPGLDGYETVKAIRNLDKGSCNAYIFALSASLTSPEMVHKCFSAGMNDCMAKPLRPKVLRTRLMRWLQKKQKGVA